MAWFVYILRCSDGSYYVGHTQDLQQRIDTHDAGLGAIHTAARRTVELVDAEQCSTEAEAVLRESQLKRWSRARKEALIYGDLRHLRRLRKGRN